MSGIPNVDLFPLAQSCRCRFVAAAHLLYSVLPSTTGHLYKPDDLQYHVMMNPRSSALLFRRILLRQTNDWHLKKHACDIRASIIFSLLKYQNLISLRRKSYAIQSWNSSMVIWRIVSAIIYIALVQFKNPAVRKSAASLCEAGRPAVLVNGL